MLANNGWLSLLDAVSIPKPNALIGTRRGQDSAIRTPCKAVDIPRMSREHLEEITGFGIAFPQASG